MLKSITGLSRRSIIQGATLALFLPTARSANAEIALATAINRVARFRALSQRCAKAYAQIALNVLPEPSKNTLATAQKLMQAAFDDLSTNTYSDDITQQLATTRAESAKLATLLAVPAKKELLVSVSQQADKLTAQANKATELITGLAKTSSAKILDIAGKQRMLSQRIAKNYFLLAANATTAPAASAASIRQQMTADRAEFKAAFAVMQNSPISTQAIRNEMDLSNAQWFLFELSIDKQIDRPFVMEDVATSSERLLEVANNLTVLYEKALREVMGKS
jgi:Type IV pili methyl-accepting chemotaxis transducer N-term